MVLLFTGKIVDAFLLSLTLSTGFAIGITVTTQLALFPDAVAVMVVVPTANAVTTPSETVVTDSSEEVLQERRCKSKSFSCYNSLSFAHRNNCGTDISIAQQLLFGSGIISSSGLLHDHAGTSIDKFLVGKLHIYHVVSLDTSEAYHD